MAATSRAAPLRRILLHSLLFPHSPFTHILSLILSHSHSFSLTRMHALCMLVECCLSCTHMQCSPTQLALPLINPLVFLHSSICSICHILIYSYTSTNSHICSLHLSSLFHYSLAILLSFQVRFYAHSNIHSPPFPFCSAMAGGTEAPRLWDTIPLLARLPLPSRCLPSQSFPPHTILPLCAHMKAYEKQRVYQTGCLAVSIGGDQGLLNAFFADWAHTDIHKHLPFIYNCVYTSFYTYRPAFARYSPILQAPSNTPRPAFCPTIALFLASLFHRLPYFLSVTSSTHFSTLIASFFQARLTEHQLIHIFFKFFYRSIFLLLDRHQKIPSCFFFLFSPFEVSNKSCFCLVTHFSLGTNRN